MLIVINITSFVYSPASSGTIDFSLDAVRSDDPTHVISITPLTGGEYTSWDLEAKTVNDIYKLFAEVSTATLDSAWGNISGQEYNYLFTGLSINGPFYFSAPKFVEGKI